MQLSTEHIHIIEDHDPIRVQFQTQTVSDEEFAQFLKQSGESMREGGLLKTEGQDGQVDQSVEYLVERGVDVKELRDGEAPPSL